MRRRSQILWSRHRAPHAFAAALCAIALVGCATLGAGREPIEVRLVSITPLPSTSFEHRLRVDLRLRNSNDRTYEVEGLHFLLDVDSEHLAPIISSERATLPRHGELVIPVTTTTSSIELVNQIVASGHQPQPHFEYDLRGKIFLKGVWGSIPFEHHGSDRDLVPHHSTR